jgi:hypothetical protein
MRVAIVLSIPVTFLLYSIISFTVGILAFSFGGRPIRRGTSYSTVAVLGVMVIGVALVIFTLWYIWGLGTISHRIKSFVYRKLPAIFRTSRSKSDPELG